MIIIEIERNPNVDRECCVVYSDSGPSRELRALEYRRGDTREWAEVAGWDAEANSPCSAYVCPISDSGDGTALLVYGGSGGVRLKPMGDPSPWSTSDPRQWGELFLVYPLSAQFRYATES
jgi:hypothetical protein